MISAEDDWTEKVVFAILPLTVLKPDDSEVDCVTEFETDMLTIDVYVAEGLLVETTGKLDSIVDCSATNKSVVSSVSSAAELLLVRVVTTTFAPDCAPAAVEENIRIGDVAGEVGIFVVDVGIFEVEISAEVEANVWLETVVDEIGLSQLGITVLEDACPVELNIFIEGIGLKLKLVTGIIIVDWSVEFDVWIARTGVVVEIA